MIYKANKNQAKEADSFLDISHFIRLGKALRSLKTDNRLVRLPFSLINCCHIGAALFPKDITQPKRIKESLEIKKKNNLFGKKLIH